MDQQQRGRRIQNGSQDREIGEGILSGALGPQDAPTEWRPVAELLTVLRTLPATSPSLRADALGDGPLSDREARTVQSMAAILAEAPAQKAWRRHIRAPFRPSVPRPLNVFRVRLGTALVAATLAFILGLASAGRLPAPAQNAVSVALSKFGITVPRDQSGPHPHPTPVGPDLSGPAAKGLCTAFLAGQGGENGGKLDSEAFRSLQEAADSGGQTEEEFCAGVLPQTNSGSTGPHGHGKGHGKAKAKGHQHESNGKSSEEHGHGSDHSSHGHDEGHGEGD